MFLVLRDRRYKLSIGVVVEYRLKQGGADLLTAALKERLPQMREWSGCQDAYLGVDSEDACHLMVIAKWKSPEQYEAFHQWEASQSDAHGLMQFVVGGMTTLILEDSGV